MGVEGNPLAHIAKERLVDPIASDPEVQHFAGRSHRLQACRPDLFVEDLGAIGEGVAEGGDPSGRPRGIRGVLSRGPEALRIGALAVDRHAGSHRPTEHRIMPQQRLLSCEEGFQDRTVFLGERGRHRLVGDAAAFVQHEQARERRNLEDQEEARDARHPQERRLHHASL